MLFRVNMYRQGREKRLETIRRVHRLALFAAVLCVNAVVIGLFVFAIAMSDRGVAAAQTRLSATQEALDKVIEEQGGTTSDEELDLVRVRAERVLWSRVMRAVGRLTPTEMWLPRVRLANSDAVTSGRVAGLKLSGRMTAKSEEQGICILMEFVNGLRSDSYFGKHFLEPKLLRSTWVSEEGERYLEFDVFTPLNTPEAVAAGAEAMPESGWDTVNEADIDIEDGIESGNAEGGSERTS
ncbi:MAG: hypothetical protein ABIG03_06305 [Candidatus Eisenbacteria bacterium]